MHWTHTGSVPMDDDDDDVPNTLTACVDCRLLHLAIAKNERYLTEALISRLDRDKLTDSMINLRNKQGQVTDQ